MKQSKKKKSTVREPVQKRSIESRDKIIDAAYKLYKKKGYQNTGIRDIIKAADASISTFYAYFENKNAITYEVLKVFSEEIYGDFSGQLLHGLQGEDNLENVIRFIIDKMHALLKKNEKIHREFIILSLTDSAFAETYEKVKAERVWSVMIPLFRHSSFKIFVKDEKTAAFLLHRAVDEILKSLLFYKPGVDEEAVIQETVKMILLYLTAEN